MRMLLLTAISAISITTIAHAEGILDQQLGPSPTKPAEEKAAATPADKPEAKKLDRPVAPELVDPNAAKVIDDTDLIRKLTGEGGASDQAGPEAIMKQMVDRMKQSQSRLQDKDTGPITQETQRRIAIDLDAMIEFARQQQQKGQGKPDPSEQRSQQRQMSTGNQQGQNSQGGTQAATASRLPGGSSRTPESNGEDIHQKGPQEWGNLPGRDRDLIFNGANEQYLPAYKELIDRYYQALAEIGKNK